MKDEYYDAIRLLPGWLAAPLAAVPPEQAALIHEIRLRQGRPVQFTVRGQPLAAERCGPGLAALTVPPGRMEEVLYTLCGGSVHAHEEELARGFFTLPGGHRVGVGGAYTCGENGRPVLQQAESLNIRVARFAHCSLPPALQALLARRFTGLLIFGEPDSGKTTLLRSMIPFLQARGRTPVVIDSRGELLPPDAAGRQEAGCDRLAGLDKAAAVQIALRTLGPQVLLLDELGTMEEVLALEQGFFGGVDVVATLHAASFAEAERKPQVRRLLEDGFLRHACLLEGRHKPGCIRAGKDYA